LKPPFGPDSGTLFGLKVLFLSQRVPYPPNRGDKITTWRLVERLGREHEVTIIAFAHEQADHDAALELGRMGYETITVDHNDRAQRIRSLPLLLTNRPLTLGVYGSQELQKHVDRVSPTCDVAYAYSSSMGAFLMNGSTPFVMHFAELDSDKWRQYAERKSFPMKQVYRREWRTLQTYERKLAAAAGQNVFCTPLEQDIFQKVIPGEPSAVLRNGVDLTAFAPDPDAREAGHMVFSGVMDYYPNVDGCVHFVHEVLPRVREEFPDARFTIIGSRPNDEVLTLAKVKGVTVTGFVDDTRDYLCLGAIGVAPLRIARGIQNKVLEAMAMGLPVVGTKCATQGVNARHGEHYMVADSAQDQAQAIRDLLRDDARARELGASARRFVEDNYDWDVVFDSLNTILEDCRQREVTRDETRR
jgi:sugar transferase (PEP-CTERM/EpsH1 system associated)